LTARRSRLEVLILRTRFDAKRRRANNDSPELSPRLVVVTETHLAATLTLFNIGFRNLTLKAYTKASRCLSFQAIVHNTKELGCGRVLDDFPPIPARLTSEPSESGEPV
jgi:hypothetical protein